VHVSLRRGRLDSRGALLRRGLPSAVPRGATAALAFYDVKHDAWRAVPTQLSKDRRVLTAHVKHFSVWDDIVYGVSWLLDTRVDAPQCQMPTPAWVESTTFVDDKNAPLRWCAGHDPHDASVLVVKVAVNRSYGVAVSPATKPKWIYSDLFGDGPEDFIANVFARAYQVPDKVRGTFGGELPLMGGQQADFGFTEAQVRGHPEHALVHVSPDVKNAVAGFTYSALVDGGGLGDGALGKQIAAIVTFVAVAQCEGEIGKPLLEHHWARAAKGALTCLTAHSKEIGLAAASALAKALPKENPKSIGKLAGKIGGKLWQVWAASAIFRLGTWFADRHLIDAAFDMHVFPTIMHRPHTPKPAPPQTPTVAAPAPETSDLAPGSAFESQCVVAWPTAPTHTSQGIQMTMSCSGVPETKYLFTQVTYSNADFTITPSTGPVTVSGHVVDVARSEYGYSVLIVEADNIAK
jgi:hypothetical protein